MCGKQAGVYILSMFAVAVCAVVILLPFNPPNAHAAYINPVTGETTDTPPTDGSYVAETQPGTVTKQNKTADTPPKPIEVDCGPMTLLDPVKVMNCGIKYLTMALLGLMALIVWVAGLLLEGAMYLTVNMKEVLNGVPVVDTGWVVFRDLANMTFIFILLYIAISTILNRIDTKKLLVNVIITALLVNFSLFITKVVVDTSNVIALAFYGRIMSLSVADGYQLPTGPFINISQKGPAWVLFNAMRIQSIYDTSSSGATQINTTSGPNPYQSGVDIATKTVTSGAIGFVTSAVSQLINLKGGLVASQIQDPTRLIGTAVLGAVVMLVFAFVMAIGAFLLLTRIVVLMFLMMVSPLAFVANILPSMEGAWKHWWKSLINHAIFAPAFLALLYVVLQAAASGLPGMTGTFSNAFTGDPGSFGVILNYVFLIILLAGTIFVAKSLGVHGAATAEKWAKTAQGTATGFIGRNTAGRFAQRTYEKLQNTAVGRNRIGATVLRSTLGAAAASKYGSGESFKDREDAWKKELRTRKGGIDQAGADPRRLFETAHAGGVSVPDRKRMYDQMEDPRKKVVYEAEVLRRMELARAGMTDMTLSEAERERHRETHEDIQKTVAGITSYKNEKMNRDQLEKLEEAYIREFRDNPAQIAEHMASLRDTTSVRADDLRTHMYDKMSARDRVAVEQAITTGAALPAGTPGAIALPAGMTADAFTQQLRHSLSQDERDKTEKSARESARETAQDEVRRDIELLANAIQGAVASGANNPLQGRVGTPSATSTFTDPTTGNRHTITRTGRTSATVTETTAAGVPVGAVRNVDISHATDKTLESMNAGHVASVAPAMYGGQYRNLRKSNALSPIEKQRISDERHRELETAISGAHASPADAVKAFMDQLEPDDVAALDDRYLKDYLVVANLAPADLAKLAEKGVTKGARTTIATRIRSLGSAHPAFAYITTGLGKDYWK